MKAKAVQITAQLKALFEDLMFACFHSFIAILQHFLGHYCHYRSLTHHLYVIIACQYLCFSLSHSFIAPGTFQQVPGSWNISLMCDYRSIKLLNIYCLLLWSRSLPSGPFMQVAPSLSLVLSKISVCFFSLLLPCWTCSEEIQGALIWLFVVTWHLIKKTELNCIKLKQNSVSACHWQECVLILRGACVEHKQMHIITYTSLFHVKILLKSTNPDKGIMNHENTS